MNGPIIHPPRSRIRPHRSSVIAACLSSTSSIGSRNQTGATGTHDHHKPVPSSFHNVGTDFPKLKRCNPDQPFHRRCRRRPTKRMRWQLLLLAAATRSSAEHMTYNYPSDLDDPMSDGSGMSNDHQEDPQSSNALVSASDSFHRYLARLFGAGGDDFITLTETFPANQHKQEIENDPAKYQDANLILTAEMGTVPPEVESIDPFHELVDEFHSGSDEHNSKSEMLYDPAAALLDTSNAHSKFQLPKQRIVGGSASQKGRYPYQITLQKRGYPICGAILIAPDCILTAAHCYESFDYAEIGRYDLSSDSEEERDVTYLRIGIDECVYHPSFSYFINNDISDDFMVCKLKGEAKGYTPVKINSDSSVPADGQALSVIGWGRTSERGPSSKILLEATVNSVNNAVCRQARGCLSNGACYNYRGVIQSNMICAAAPDKDACQGDSGGPLMVLGQDATEDVVVGVVSFGVGCAEPDFPGIYARVSYRYQWIADTVERLSDFGGLEEPDLTAGDESTSTQPSASPSRSPSRAPSKAPSSPPTDEKTSSPPSRVPSSRPSRSPTIVPSSSPVKESSGVAADSKTAEATKVDILTSTQSDASPNTTNNGRRRRRRYRHTNGVSVTFTTPSQPSRGRGRGRADDRAAGITFELAETESTGTTKPAKKAALVFDTGRRSIQQPLRKRNRNRRHKND